MMSNAITSDLNETLLRRSLIARLGGRIMAVVRFFIACLACLTPVTAVFVLGALQQFGRRVIARRLHESGVRTNAISPVSYGDAAPSKDSSGWFGVKTMYALMRGYFVEGAQALFSLSLATLPFSLLWLFSWWAGWENSFNKGYEQSWVGPTLGLFGVFVALNVLAYLPMGLAHQATEKRWQSFFQVRRVVSLITQVGARYVALAVVTVIAALPLFAAQGLPVFIEQLVPGFDTYSPEQVEEVAGRFKILTAAYIVLALFMLRWFAARLYARVLVPAMRRHPALWQGSTYVAAQESSTEPLRKARFSRIRKALLVAALWVVLFGLVAQIFVAQFLNYQWWNWLSHPFFLLPWTR